MNKNTVGVMYPRYHRPPVTVQNSRYDQFPPVAKAGEPYIPYQGMAPPLQAEE
jgi:hypothetical protein